MSYLVDVLVVDNSETEYKCWEAPAFYWLAIKLASEKELVKIKTAINKLISEQPEFVIDKQKAKQLPCDCLIYFDGENFKSLNHTPVENLTIKKFLELK